MKILVTGCNGQLGRELHNVLESRMPGLTLYTDIDTLDLTDINTLKAYVKDNDISHIVNCAAYTDVERAEEDKALCTKVNVEAVRNLAVAAFDAGAKVIHISTDYVFDGTAHLPYCESDKVNPLSQYGTTKRQGETALIALAPESIIIRTAWLYSPYGKNFVKTMLRLGSTHQSLSVVCDQIGTPTYALDLANAICAILSSRQWVPGIYHFTDAGVASWYDFAQQIFRLSGNNSVLVSPVPATEYPTVATRPCYSVLNCQRIIATYDVVQPYWVDSLADCLRRLKD